MDTQKTNKLNTIQENNQKDIEKRQKIIAGMYLVTNHLLDNEPLKYNLRSTVSEFVFASEKEIKDLVFKMETILGASVFSRLISEKNSSIILSEIKKFYESRIGSENIGSSNGLEGLFGSESFLQRPVIKDNKRTKYFGLTGNNSNQKSYLFNKTENKSIINKDDRQNKILSFINERKSVVIKDIVSLFPEVSEKTIQRELNRLIDLGQINKKEATNAGVFIWQSTHFFK